MTPTHQRLFEYVRDWVASFPVSLLDSPKRSQFVRAMNSPEVRNNHKFLSTLAWQLYAARLELQALSRRRIELSGYELLQEAWQNAVFFVSEGQDFCKEIERRGRLPGRQPATSLLRKGDVCPDCGDANCFGAFTARSYGTWLLVPINEHMFLLSVQRADVWLAMHAVPVEIVDE